MYDELVVKYLLPVRYTRALVSNYLKCGTSTALPADFNNWNQDESGNPICKLSAKTLLISSLLLFLSIPVNALKTGGHVKADLVAEVEWVQPGRPFWVAVQLKMQKDWHTYWKNPGESGAPTKIKWMLPPGFKAGPLLWPYPKKIAMPPVTTYGYENEVWLLTEITPPEDLSNGNNILLQAHIDWLECSVECIPGEADVTLSLQINNKPMRLNPQYTQKFSSARSQLPLEATDWQFNSSLMEKKLRIFIHPPPWFEDKLTAAEFFSDAPRIIDYSAVQIFRANKSNVYTLDINVSDSATEPVTSLTGVLVIEPGFRGTSSEKAVNINLSIAPPAPFERERLNIFLPFLFAFLGGILLNLMPCVLPVLSIKILGFIQKGSAHRSDAIKHAACFALGILTSFWTLAGVLVFLRSSGQQLGWGFQMQSPSFVFLLISLFFLLGLNLLGAFEIGTAFTRLGSVSLNQNRLTGAFMSGALTTLVATPCTAPFMGSALGFASTQTAFISFGVFTFLGLGVSVPYVVLSIFPQLLAFVPKPGEWMDSLKQFMGFLMFGTAAWLFWVLSLQKGAFLVPLIWILLLQAIAAWIFGRWGTPPNSGFRRLIAFGLAVSILGGSLLWGLREIKEAKVQTRSDGTKNNLINWEPFSPELVVTYRKQGKPVFVDFTAAWCLTCQVNERVALNSEPVARKFQEKNVAMLKGDWTSQDPVITQALEKFGRNGVPFYLLYPPEEKNAPITLPEILTPQIVLDALKKIN